jgi:hypothetical protein
VSRLIDSAEGKFLNTGRESRMRCQFYVGNPAAIEGYILSPVVFDSFSSLNSFPSMDVLRAYVGIKINKGVITVCVKESGGSELNYPTPFSFSGSGFTDTLVLEIRHHVNYTDVYIDNQFIGSYSTDLITGFSSTLVFLPLFSPARSYGGTVSITIENYQFLQEK